MGEKSTSAAAFYMSILALIGAVVLFIRFEVLEPPGVSTMSPVQAASIPVGTVAAYAGPRESIPSGWALCDGRAIDLNTSGEKFGALFEVVGTSHGAGFENSVKKGHFNLPDYRGMFLRGVSIDAAPQLDPDREERVIMNEGGNAGNKVGSIQGHGTGLPANPFVTSAGGVHNHATDGYDQILRFGGDGTSMSQDYSTDEPVVKTSASMSASGNHYHVINQGGDMETRPVNAYVYWIIRL